jgi:predicted RNA binding protein YcfA (HicA-like mRNA interferase family)
MKALSGKELAKLLEKRGWELRRIHGSHHIYVRPGGEERFVCRSPFTVINPSK